jgi:transposase-like protein
MRDPYKGYRLLKSVIGFAVRYYYRYKISLRDLSMKIGTQVDRFVIKHLLS